MPRRKRKVTFSFELGLGGLLGLATLCFCIFLWLFLLGVWAGQTVLLPSADSERGQELESFARDLWQRGRQSVAPQTRAVEEKAPSLAAPLTKKAVGEMEDEEEEPSFFTLQVATFDERADAKEEVARWQAKGQESFYLPPMEGADYFRVFIGHFATLDEANDKVNSLEKKSDVQAFITLLPARNIGR